jgi:uncharacterized protein YndB with AHSA1/START domain
VYGRLDQVAGRWRLRFSRTIGHPPEKVWRALTQPEHLAAWFPTTVDGERAVGAALRFTFPGEEAPPFEGRMLTYDWPSTLEFTWGDDILDGAGPGSDPDWTAVHADYVDRFGPAAATIGPPEPH